MKIWGRDNSTNVRKVLWCAEELGLQYEHILAGGSFGVVASQDCAFRGDPVGDSDLIQSPIPI